ncbi:hypothetical protein F7725_021777 [Dissostichus mawsoni]|uniref:Uncharacterized protein n=1 Tax=Dissostichus mawsoni TaxID=36200 RepID=A0A7J5ZG95_DISMA|nr:hypothetical protein F7725_021777 [Dissostichus mawsoni]
MVKMQNFSCTAERVFAKIAVDLISPTVGRPSVMNMMRETLFGPASGLERYSRSRSEPVWMPPSIFVPARRHRYEAIRLPHFDLVGEADEVKVIARSQILQNGTGVDHKHHILGHRRQVFGGEVVDKRITKSPSKPLVILACWTMFGPKVILQTFFLLFDHRVGAPAVAQRQHLEVGDGGVVHDGDVQAEAADQLERSQARHVFVASEPPLQQLLIRLLHGEVGDVCSGGDLEAENPLCGGAECRLSMAQYTAVKA